ncbi:MAG: hypothetical protein AW08_02548 [Candidatus Accumulibacter adjunctus]|uniref:Uncharacterized protein n=1 Tax=Candidatus Accumulibacter adjunctus TaxID=1454001 RepID=A0A011PJK4_9PROT|nr:MAG: hypothetical protein AW08_02548 [Candidatus Accumulibacter adjunctus]
MEGLGKETEVLPLDRCHGEEPCPLVANARASSLVRLIGASTGERRARGKRQVLSAPAGRPCDIGPERQRAGLHFGGATADQPGRIPAVRGRSIRTYAQLRRRLAAMPATTAAASRPSVPGTGTPFDSTVITTLSRMAPMLSPPSFANDRL